jgi:4-amino-4-deoxy-L-arabinose transferase-like glycosyltransferase
MDTYIREYKLLGWLLALAVLIHFHNLFLPLFDNDSSLYAEISREMFAHHDYGRLTLLDAPMMDKPHLLFWLSALSYQVFGVSGFAYKFPSFLAFLGTLVAVYYLCQHYYNRTTALYATCITASALGMGMMTNDVRTDTLLTCFVTCGVWQVSSYIRTRHIWHWIWAIVSIAAAYYTKGALGLVIPILALGPHLIRYYGWRYSLRLGILTVVGVAILLIPLFIIAYHQFGWIGLRFFVWDHVTGRLTGVTYHNNPDALLLWHSMLWVIAPWTLLLLVGIWQSIREWLPKTAQAPVELISLSGLLLGLTVLSFSAFKLSHYVYPFVPFAAIVIASYYSRHKSHGIVRYMQQSICIIAILLSAVVIFYLTPVSYPYIIGYVLLCLGYIYLSRASTMMVRTMLVAMMMHGVLSFSFYPTILSYMPYADTAALYHERHLTLDELVVYKMGVSPQLAFYLQDIPHSYFDLASMQSARKHSPVYVLTPQDGYDEIQQSGVPFTVEKRLFNFRLTMLTLDFINPTTREAVCDKLYLVKLK